MLPFIKLLHGNSKNIPIRLWIHFPRKLFYAAHALWSPCVLTAPGLALLHAGIRDTQVYKPWIVSANWSYTFAIILSCYDIKVCLNCRIWLLLIMWYGSLCVYSAFQRVTDTGALRCFKPRVPWQGSECAAWIQRLIVVRSPGLTFGLRIISFQDVRRLNFAINTHFIKYSKHQ